VILARVSNVRGELKSIRIESPKIATQQQKLWAEHLGIDIYYKNSIGMVFVLIPPGEFTMGRVGDPIAPLHVVHITKPFYIGITEVTQEQYKAIKGKNPAYFQSEGNWKRYPVEQVSHHDAVEFCKELKQRCGENYRLPTEAEWEFACRAGSALAYCFGNTTEKLDNYGWYDANSNSCTHEVAMKPPNVFGLYDMHGNVWEWVEDHMSTYPDDDVSIDPVCRNWKGLNKQLEQRVLRGGAWNVSADRCGCGIRLHNYSGYYKKYACYAPYVGFRIIRDISSIDVKKEIANS